MNLLTRLKGGRPPDRRNASLSLEDYASQLNSFYNCFSYGYGSGGLSLGVQQTLGGGAATEMAPNNFVGLASQAYASNGVVFACMLVRQLLFSSIRFRWQRLRNGTPSTMFYTPALDVLQAPWPGGTTQDMLSRMIQDADLAGNSYWTLQTSLARLGTNDPSPEFVRLRPDWVGVILGERRLADGRGQIGWEPAGYVYAEQGWQSGSDPVGLLPYEVVHFAPIPDPLSYYTGMSWLTPILREIQNDQAMTRHQRKFFDNGASPNMVIKHHPDAKQEAVQAWVKEFDTNNVGLENAYRRLNLYPGADVTVVGCNLKDIDFGDVRAGGEVRIAAASGVAPIIVGLSKGLDSSTYSNYGQARRRVADGTAQPLWQNMVGSIQPVLKLPGRDVRLWYDTCDTPFLREDEKDMAEISSIKAATVSSYIASGYEPESVIQAVTTNDLGLLKHSGLYSVQLQQPDGSSPRSESSFGDDTEGFQ